jgi:hypothetical protein
VKDNSRALLEMCFYIVSLRGWYSPYDFSRTPGMLSMNLNCLETASSSSSKSPLLNTSLTAILGCVGLKWTYVRFKRLAVDQGKQKIIFLVVGCGVFCSGLHFFVFAAIGWHAAEEVLQGTVKYVQHCYTLKFPIVVV